MRIELKNLMKLQVRTKFGTELGRVKNIIFETDGQSVLQYEIGEVFGKKYLISREQVISLDDKKMIVDDNIVGANGYSPAPDLSAKKIKIEPEGVMTSETGN